MAPPVPYLARPLPRSMAAVRMATANRACDGFPGARYPTAPEQTLLWSVSRSAMICIDRALGAPVTEPDGKSAANTSTKARPGDTSAAMVEVSCHTVWYRSRVAK